MEKEEFIKEARKSGAPAWYIKETIAAADKAKAEGITIPYEAIPIDFPED